MSAAEHRPQPGCPVRADRAGVEASGRSCGASSTAPTGRGRGSASRTRCGCWRATLRARGIAPGDRVLLVSENRPEWLIADLAIMAAGGITVPAYTTNTEPRARLPARAQRRCRRGRRGRPPGEAAAAGGRRGAGAAAAGQHRAAQRCRRARAAAAVLAARRWPRASGSPAPRPTPAATLARQDTCLLHLHLRHRRHAQGRDAEPRQPAGQRQRRATRRSPCSASTSTRCSSRSCRSRTPTSTPPGSSCRSRSAPRSTTPTGSRRCRPTCSRRGRR